jgi:hypothetical protein
MNEKKKLRRKVLEAHHELSDGNVWKPVSRSDAAQRLELNSNDEGLLAVIAYLEDVGLATLTKYFVFSASLYLTGLIIIIIAILILSSARFRYGRFWERVARGDIQIDFHDIYAKAGKTYGNLGNALIFLSLVCFASGSIAALVGFAKA